MPFCIGWVENFDEITLSCTVKKIEAYFCFSIFGKRKIFWKLPRVHFLDTLWVENFAWQICVFPFWAKIRKFKMATICGEGKIFWKLESVNFLDTLWVENFDKIALSGTVKGIEAILCFAILWEKFENSKWLPFLGRGKFFENCQQYIGQIPCCLIISTKSLYLARLRR